MRDLIITIIIALGLIGLMVYSLLTPLPSDADGDAEYLPALGKDKDFLTLPEDEAIDLLDAVDKVKKKDKIKNNPEKNKNSLDNSRDLIRYWNDGLKTKGRTLQVSNGDIFTSLNALIEDNLIIAL